MLNIHDQNQKMFPSGSCIRSCTYTRRSHERTWRGTKHDRTTLVGSRTEGKRREKILPLPLQFLSGRLPKVAVAPLRPPPKVAVASPLRPLPKVTIFSFLAGGSRGAAAARPAARFFFQPGSHPFPLILQSTEIHQSETPTFLLKVPE